MIIWECVKIKRFKFILNNYKTDLNNGTKGKKGKDLSYI